MKIAFLVVKNITRGGGIEKFTREVGPRLVQRGHSVTVYSMRHYGDVPTNYLGMRIICVPSIPIVSMQKLSSSITAAIRSYLDNGFDILHFHSVAAGSFAWIARLRRQRCVLQMHGLEWKRSRWGTFGSLVLKVLERVALTQAHVCTAVSLTQCDYYAKHFGIEMIYIPTGTDVKPKAKAKRMLELGVEPSRYILFASRLVREKGAHYLIDAFKPLDTDMKLVIVGHAPGEKKYKKDLLELAGKDSRILLTAFVDDQVLEELFSNAYVYVLPSEIEGLSAALLEAMGYGNCCLVSDIPENLEAIGEAGFRFKSKSVNSLQERLDWLINHSQEVTNAGLFARERARKQYSWEYVADKIEDLYLNILS